MTPSDDFWGAISAAIVGGVGGFFSSWMRDRIKMAKLEATLHAFMDKSDERHHDNQKAIETIADTVNEINRYMRNGWREKGH